MYYYGRYWSLSPQWKATFSTEQRLCALISRLSISMSDSPRVSSVIIVWCEHCETVSLKLCLLVSFWTDFYFHEFSLNRHYHFYCSPFAWHCSPTANQHYGWRNGTVLIAFITSIHNLGEDISVEKTNTPVVEEINCPVSLSEDWLRVILWERSFSGMHSNQN